MTLDPQTALVLTLTVIGTIVLVYVWLALALQAMFTKIGIDASLAWIPFINAFTLVRLGGTGLAPWTVLVPFYNFYVLVASTIGVSKKFGRSASFGILGLIIPVWASVLGWGSAQWLGSPGRAALGEDAVMAHESSNAAGSEWQPFAPLLPEASAVPQPPAMPAGVPPVPPVPPVPQPPAPAPEQPWADVPAQPWQAAPEQSWGAVPEQPGAAYAPPAPTFAAQPMVPPPPTMSAADAAALPVFGNPGSTRMREDSEVIAEARQAMVPPPLPPVVETPIAADESDATPIVIAGPNASWGYGAAADVPAPPVPLAEQVPPVVPVAPIDEDSDWMENSLSSGIVGAPAPVSAVSAVPMPAPAAPVDETSTGWAPRNGRGRSDAAAIDVPAENLVADNLEMSGSVSAVAGAPVAGTPRSALAAVSAQHHEAGVGRVEEGFDNTVVAARRRPVWHLNLPVGTSVALTSDYVIVGRKPDDEPEFASAQLVSIADGTRTISKTHAVLALVDGVWTITDLGSTNGVVLINDDGSENELEPHVPAALTTRFYLGDAELSMTLATS